MNKIGIMLGRLSSPISNRIQAFPVNSWREDLVLASTCGFDVVGWIFDDLQPNPIMSVEGISEIKSMLSNNHISINSVSCDYFMTSKLFDVSEHDLEKNLDILTLLIRNCHALDISILELPFVDLSSIKEERHRLDVYENIIGILDQAEKYGISLAFETDLPPPIFKIFLEKFDHPSASVNYDVGNSASNGYDMLTEFKTYGSFISNIHIKDRLLHGSTVPLGEGNVDFDSFFSTIFNINYTGSLIIQGAREDLSGSTATPESTCKKYLNFIKGHFGAVNHADGLFLDEEKDE